MNAAILTNRLYDWVSGELAIGGGERYTIDLARLLVEHGFTVDVFQPTLRGPFKRELEPGINVIAVRPELEYAQPEKWMCDEFYRRTPTHDIHLVTMPEYMSGKVHKGTISLTQGCTWFNKSSRDLEKFEKQALRKYIEKSDKAITIHKYVKEEMLDLGIGHDISVVNHGIDTDVFFPGGGRFYVVMFPGRAEVSKGTEYYKELGDIKEFAGHPDWTYSWCGTGSEQDSLPNRFDVPLEEMPQIYRETNIACVFNTHTREVPLTLLEAMSSECACIAFHSTQDAIVDGVNGLTASRDVEDIHRKIITLIEDSKLRKRLGKAARETILNDYSKKVWRENWIEIFGL